MTSPILHPIIDFSYIRCFTSLSSPSDNDEGRENGRGKEIEGTFVSEEKDGGEVKDKEDEEEERGGGRRDDDIDGYTPMKC